MLASELIKQLTDMMNKHGDLEVWHDTDYLDLPTEDICLEPPVYQSCYGRELPLRFCLLSYKEGTDD